MTIIIASIWTYARNRGNIFWSYNDYNDSNNVRMKDQTGKSKHEP